MEQALERLERLYEISKLFASFESVEKTFNAALRVTTRVLPLRSAILIELEDGHSKMSLWPADAESTEEMSAARSHLEAAFAYLAGPTSPVDAVDVGEHTGMPTLPKKAGTAPNWTAEERFIVIPLLIARGPIFGALQLEASSSIEEHHVSFASAVGNQLAIAIDRDRAWRQTQQAVRVREQILEIVSHDLKTPLNTILMAAAVLARDGMTEERQTTAKNSVLRIHRSAERMQRLIEDLLDFASIELGRLSMKMEAQDAASIVQETLETFELQAPRTAVLSVQVEPGLPSVVCDRDRILQVISNLVGNASNVVSDDGKIGLMARAHGGYVLFAVSDNGPGISAEDSKHLFKRYWRSGEVNYRGTGLGLAIARGIVNAHGGRIWVESELGHGATFYFSVPVAPPSPDTPR